jgi:hypothetical protein
MKRIFKILTILFVTSSVYGQIDDMESLITRKVITCQDIEYNAQFLIPEYYHKDSKDTLNSIIEYWQSHCGLREAIIRCKILLAIDNDEFNEDLYDAYILNCLTDYMYSFESYRNINGEVYISNNWGYFYSQPDTLGKFTVNLARKLLKRDDLEAIETFFLRMYSNDYEGTFAMLQSDEFNDTEIQKYYLNEIDRYNSQFIGHGDFLLGAWIPQGNLKTIGAHPFFGFRGGIKYKRLVTDLTLGFRAGKSPNDYQVFKNDSIWNTDHYFGGYIGMDLGLEMFRIKRSSFDLIGGVAFDGFDVLDVGDPNSNTNITKTLNSLNLNIGLGYKYNINPWNYIGIDCKYNIVDYKNNMGTDLIGNAFTINLIYGFYGNRHQMNRLSALGYCE